MREKDEQKKMEWDRGRVKERKIGRERERKAGERKSSFPRKNSSATETIIMKSAPEKNSNEKHR